MAFLRQRAHGWPGVPWAELNAPRSIDRSTQCWEALAASDFEEQAALERLVLQLTQLSGRPLAQAVVLPRERAARCCSGT